MITRAYELMVIIDSEADDLATNAVIDRIGQLVEAGDGRIANTERWGRRTFAYEINKKTEGYYVVFEIVTEGPNLDEVDRYLRIADDAVRHKIIRLPDGEATKRGLLGQAPAEAG